MRRRALHPGSHVTTTSTAVRPTMLSAPALSEWRNSRPPDVTHSSAVQRTGLNVPSDWHTVVRRSPASRYPATQFTVRTSPVAPVTLSTADLSDHITCVEAQGFGVQLTLVKVPTGT